MTKAVVIHIPRGAVPSLPHDLDFSRNLYNAILEAENSGLDASVKIGDKYKAVVELFHKGGPMPTQVRPEPVPEPEPTSEELENQRLIREQADILEREHREKRAKFYERNRELRDALRTRIATFDELVEIGRLGTRIYESNLFGSVLSPHHPESESLARLQADLTLQTLLRASTSDPVVPNRRDN